VLSDARPSQYLADYLERAAEQQDALQRDPYDDPIYKVRAEKLAAKAEREAARAAAVAARAQRYHVVKHTTRLDSSKPECNIILDHVASWTVPKLSPRQQASQSSVDLSLRR
jgi:hypothetical protein